MRMRNAAIRAKELTHRSCAPAAPRSGCYVNQAVAHGSQSTSVMGGDSKKSVESYSPPVTL